MESVQITGYVAYSKDIMKPTTYINWDGLKDIPFFYCDTKEDEENKDFDIYYQWQAGVA